MLRLSLIKFAHFIVLLCAVIIVIYTYRFEQSYDFYNYKNWFEIVNSYYSPHFIFKDPFYYFLSIFYGSLGFSVLLPIVTLVFLSLFTKLIFAFRLSYAVFILFVWLYFCRVFFIHDLIQFRIAAASGFGALFVSCLIDNKRRLSIFWLFLAIITHMSTLLYVFIFNLFSISKKSCHTNRYFYLFFSFVPLCLAFGTSEVFFVKLISMIPIVGDRVVPYINGTYAYESLSLINTYLLAKILFYIVFIFLNLKKQISQECRGAFVFHYLSFFCSVLGTCFFLLFRWNDALALRFSDTFLIFDVLFFSMFVNYFNANSKVLVSILIFVFGLFLLYPSLRV